MSNDVEHFAEKTALDRLYEIADGQAGYFTTRQAVSAGIGRSLLSHHAREGGPLIRVRRGLYRLRRFPASPREDIVAEWLASGQPIDAVVSHESAAELHDLTDIIPDKLHMTASLRHTGRRAPRGVKLHFTTDGVPHSERTERDGVPTTTADRTIIDLFAVRGLNEQTELAIAQALDRGFTTSKRLREIGAARSKAALSRVNRALKRLGR
jgi:predicted transcriptional regulator of viral defense system